MVNSISNDEILGIGFFAWIILGVIFAFISHRQERINKDKPLPIITDFRAPLGMRLFMAAISIIIVTAWPLIYAGNILDTRGHRPFLTAEDWSLFGLLELICIAVGIPIFYLSGPNDIFLDVDRRTYRRIYGWPFHPHIQEGPWDDMAGVYVWCRQINSQYCVGITWKRNRWDSQHLGMFSGSGEADRWAKGVATTLGLPLVEPPPPRKQSADIRNGRP